MTSSPSQATAETNRTKIIELLPRIDQAKLRYLLGEEVGNGNRQNIFDQSCLVLQHSDLFEPQTVEVAEAAINRVFGITGDEERVEIQLMATLGPDPEESRKLADQIAAIPGMESVTRITATGVEVHKP